MDGVGKAFDVSDCLPNHNCFIEQDGKSQSETSGFLYRDGLKGGPQVP